MREVQKRSTRNCKSRNCFMVVSVWSWTETNFGNSLSFTLRKKGNNMWSARLETVLPRHIINSYIKILIKNCSYVFNIPTKLTRTVECTYIFLYLSNPSYIFQRILHRPQGEFLSTAQNYVLILMLLHWLQNTRCVSYVGFTMVFTIIRTKFGSFVMF
jgi:hypothetical protein